MHDRLCHFCGNREEDGRKLFTGTKTPAAYICDECVLLLADILHEEKLPRPSKPPPALVPWTAFDYEGTRLEWWAMRVNVPRKGAKLMVCVRRKGDEGDGVGNLYPQETEPSSTSPRRRRRSSPGFSEPAVGALARLAALSTALAGGAIARRPGGLRLRRRSPGHRDGGGLRERRARVGRAVRSAKRRLRRLRDRADLALHGDGCAQVCGDGVRASDAACTQPQRDTSVRPDGLVGRPRDRLHMRRRRRRRPDVEQLVSLSLRAERERLPRHRRARLRRPRDGLGDRRLHAGEPAAASCTQTARTRPPHTALGAGRRPARTAGAPSPSTAGTRSEAPATLTSRPTSRRGRRSRPSPPIPSETDPVNGDDWPTGATDPDGDGVPGVAFQITGIVEGRAGHRAARVEGVRDAPGATGPRQCDQLRRAGRDERRLRSPGERPPRDPVRRGVRAHRHRRPPRARHPRARHVLVLRDARSAARA